jgi:uncharacterized protein
VNLPTDNEIRALHERLAPTGEAFDLVYTHCQIVRSIAEQLLRRKSIAEQLLRRNQAEPDADRPDPDLVRAGSLLHDIGVYQLYDRSGTLDHAGYLRHGVLGRDLLRALGFPEALCRFCAHHVGVGLSRDDVLSQGLPLPVEDYLAESVEEELVMYADKFHSKSSPPTFVTVATATARLGRFGADKADGFVALVDRFGEPELASLAADHRQTLR